MNAASKGIVALNANNTALVGLGSSSAFLGAFGSRTLTRNAYAAGAGSTYRLGGGGGALTLAGTNPLTGANAVIVGSTQTNGSGTVIFSSNVNYSGSTTVASGGALIVSEAGGAVTGLRGEAFQSRGGSVLASNGRLHDAMLEVIRSRR